MVHHIWSRQVLYHMINGSPGAAPHTVKGLPHGHVRKSVPQKPQLICSMVQKPHTLMPQSTNVAVPQPRVQSDLLSYCGENQWEHHQGAQGWEVALQQ